MKYKKLIFLIPILLGVLTVGSFRISAEDENPQVKGLLSEALKLYSEHQYVRALDLFKQVQAIDPANSTAQEYIKNTKQRILEWELQGSKEEGTKTEVNWDTLTKPKERIEETPANAKDIIAARKSLVEKMKNRSSNTDNIVQIKDTGKRLEVTLFHDQLFLPGLQTLRDEALPILDNVAQLIRTGGDREVEVQSLAHAESKDSFDLTPQIPVDDNPALSQLKSNESSLVVEDIETTRSLILFSYLGQRSLGNPSVLRHQ